MKSQNSKIAEDIQYSSIIDSLIQGEVVTVPTETVEGYAVSLHSEAAIKKLMKIKDRGFDSGKVFTLVPESKEAIAKYVIIPPQAQGLIRQYIPGELTLLLPKNPTFTDYYFDHFDKIGIRIPNHPLFPTIAKLVGPILLTSANPRGGTPKSVTGHKPSTIIDFTTDSPTIVRQGNLIISI